MKSLAFPAVVALLVASLAACATARPVLYPNPKLNQSGPAVSKLAAEDCQRKADAANVDDGQAAEVAKSTGVGAAVGAATGAAVGAVFGNAGRGAASGAAGGGAHGLIGGLFRSSGPSPLYKAYVDRCLRDQGYEVLGWK
ncbi:glycine zipper family protein [Nevskia sp.]|uniref:glycine zipper family protein n=1 Tax=Nevskia sp. TaxID=1929292 RepID=UPI0025D7D093|nr:glycine zipper family protein [Nevskia sp.]